MEEKQNPVIGFIRNHWKKGVATLFIASVGWFIHSVNTMWSDKSEEYLYTERKKALADGNDSLVRAIDDEINCRMDEQYEKENPNPKGRVHREHGWYLSNDD